MLLFSAENSGNAQLSFSYVSAGNSKKKKKKERFLNHWFLFRRSVNPLLPRYITEVYLHVHLDGMYFTLGVFYKSLHITNIL